MSAHVTDRIGIASTADAPTNLTPGGQPLGAGASVHPGDNPGASAEAGRASAGDSAARRAAAGASTSLQPAAFEYPKGGLGPAGLSRAEFDALGRLFERCELRGLLLGSKAKIFVELEERGLCEWIEVALPGRFPVLVKGYRLTLAGHYAFCAACGEIPESVILSGGAR